MKPPLKRTYRSEATLVDVRRALESHRDTLSEEHRSYVTRHAGYLEQLYDNDFITPGNKAEACARLLERIEYFARRQRVAA